MKLVLLLHFAFLVCKLGQSAKAFHELFGGTARSLVEASIRKLKAIVDRDLPHSHIELHAAREVHYGIAVLPRRVNFDVDAPGAAVLPGQLADAHVGL